MKKLSSKIYYPIKKGYHEKFFVIIIKFNCDGEHSPC